VKQALDTSVIIAALDGDDPDHTICRQLFLSTKFSLYAHALSETFATLTGGRLAFRLAAAEAASILRHHVVPRIGITLLAETDLLKAYEEATDRGIRGGAIYDYLHLAAARKAGASRIYTLNTVDFLAFQRAGDPAVLRPR
jgi:predicted nucleic acid-binding protein